MKTRKTLSKVLAMVLCAMMLLSVIPMPVFAEIENYNKDYQSETHTVFKHTEQTLAPGVTNYTNYAYSSDGKQMVYYVTTADLTRDDVVAQVAYKDMQNDVYGMDKLSNMVACANEKYSDPTNPQFISEYYTVVSACNGDGYNMQTGEPSGVFIMGGNVKKDWNKASNPVFLAILKDGTAVIDNTQEAWDACKAVGIQEAIDIFGSNLVWDGKDVTANASGSYNTDRHSRTMVGITADGKLVICVLDGRQEPFSCGGTMHELAQIMLEAGCWRAFNLDGGGSTTFIAKNEGSNECTIQNRPSDGSERSISNGIIIASTAVPSNVFDHVSMVAEDEYLTVGSSTNVTVTGVSPAGTSAEIPAEVTYEVENGTYKNGVLTAVATGDVVLTAKLGDKTVGSVTIHCVVPEAIKFASDTITVPFGKTATLEMIATTNEGLNEVVTNASNFVFTLENEAAGTFDGLNFTACEDSAGIIDTTLTATFVDSELTATTKLVFGKGSVVLWDFEDGDVSNWTRTNTANYNYILTPGTTSLGSVAEGGKAHSGDKSLKVNMDFSVTTEGGYLNARLKLQNNAMIDFGKATSFGMWVHVPFEAKSLNGRIFLCKVLARDEDGNIATHYNEEDGKTYYQYYNEETGKYETSYEGYYVSNSMIPLDGNAGHGNWDVGFVNAMQESGWRYIYFDLTQFPKGACLIPGAVVLDMYVNDRDNTNFNYNHLEHKSLNQDVTIYIDDITLDYSSVVEDREPPIFSGVKYADQAMSDAAALADKQVIGGNTSNNHFAFSADVAENTKKNNATGLDASTATAYIDGNKVGCKYDNGKLSIDDVVLLNGNHTLKFTICDKQGNYSSIIRTFTVNADGNTGSTILLKAHDETLDKILLGSLYYVDLVATNVEDVQSVTTDLDLNNISHWELDHMEVAPGFEASYQIIDEEDNIARITITRTGKNDATGEVALVSMPIRTWELACMVCDGDTSAKGKVANYPFFKAGSETWPIDISVTVKAGLLNNTTTFAGDNVQVDTESYVWDNATKPAEYATWNGGHDHRASTKDLYAAGTTNHVDAVAQPDKEPTCTETGYTGRTYCEVCNSVVDWGTTVPATGHSYEFVDGVLKCTVCGDLFTGTYEGVEYVDGLPKADGWAGDSYYVDGQKLTGIHKVTAPDNSGEFYYDFGDDGVCEDRTKYTGIVANEGDYYYAKLGTLASGWIDLDGAWYYFRPWVMVAATGSYKVGDVTFEFDSNGKLLHGAWTTVDEGRRYYYGPTFYRAQSAATGVWVTIDGEQYAFDSKGIAFTGINKVTESNEKAVNVYDFDENGVLIGKLNTPDFTGIITTKNAGIFYFENGSIVESGLIQWNGDYYYVRSNGSVMVGRIYISTAKANGLFEAGTYEFGADGKMINVPASKDGVVDGFYYESNVLMKDAGLIQWNGDYYYVRSNGSVMVGRIYISTAKANDLFEAGTYEFGADGKMINVPASKDGVVDGFYYESNVLMKDAGLIQWNGDYYYVRSNGSVMVGRIYISTAKANSLFEAGTYEFGADGKMINVPASKDGVVDGFYYESNVLMKDAGLIQWNGDYYYVRSNGSVMVGRIYISTAKANSLFEAGTYEFGADGKMINVPASKDGVVDGFYYESNVLMKDAGLIQWNGDYYYVRSNGSVMVGRIYISTAKANGLFEAGTYEFGADGKMITK